MSIDLQTLSATELKNQIASAQVQLVVVQSHTKRKVVSTSLPVLAKQTTVLAGRPQLSCCIFAYCY
ncbi:hypothetical protein [Dickeya dianthicola]|uniref:hypothetical protein n=1 Tax=Dickeya dianthicola TaxID=204039 RepID=UPI001F1B8A93|nr:hypothetical protein [Dickeya dianthicola]MCI4188322.1 hypothetical protein [Dickeya dianthicola]